MKCWYKIEFVDKDKNPVKFIPEGLKNTNRDIFYFDYYANACGNRDTFYKQIKKLSRVRGEIKKISIDYRRTKENKDHSAYNVVFGNKYMKKIIEFEGKKFKYVKPETRKVPGKNVYEKDVVCVDMNSEPFINMKDFVFGFLEEDSEGFFKQVYTRKNGISTLMNQYAYLYDKKNKDELSPEEFEELSRKEIELTRQISRYRTFRALAIDRVRYEERVFKQEEREDKKAEKEMKQAVKITGDMEPEFEDYKTEYNQEFDEFLSEDEFCSMTGEGNTLHIGKR